MGKFPAGNLLLSFATLCAGASIKKMLTVFRHMGVLVYNEPTYYYHQRHLLIPTIISFWRKYQTKLLDSLKGKEVVLAGDGRHDSMGHSAKYGTYTIFCCTVGLIIHIVLLQASEKKLIKIIQSCSNTKPKARVNLISIIIINIYELQNQKSKAMLKKCGQKTKSECLNWKKNHIYNKTPVCLVFSRLIRQEAVLVSSLWPSRKP